MTAFTVIRTIKKAMGLNNTIPKTIRNICKKCSQLSKISIPFSLKYYKGQLLCKTVLNSYALNYAVSRFSYQSYTIRFLIGKVPVARYNLTIYTKPLDFSVYAMI